MNRILNLIAETKKAISERIQKGLTTQEKADKMNRDLDMDFEMYCDFQNRKSLSFASGNLTLDEAQTVYGFLGNTPDHFNRQPIEVKYVLTQLYAAMLKKEMQRRGMPC